MIQLNKILPPFAPDYSGACAALFGLGGLTVLHGPGGCIGNYTSYDEPRWFGSDVETVGSGLRELDAVLGNDDRLICQIKDAVRRSSPRFVCIAGTPVPMMTGTDFQGIAAEVEAETGIPCFGVSTTGFGSYEDGASLATLEYVKRFMPHIDRKKGILGIWGGTALDFPNREILQSIRDLCEQYGWKPVFCPEETERSGIEVNLVVSGSGQKAAEYIFETCKIPYVTGMPVGKEATERLFALLRQVAADGECEQADPTAYLEGKDNQESRKSAKVLLMGEQVMANAIRNSLAVDHGVEEVLVCGLFTRHREWELPGDLHADSERKISRVIQECGCQIVVGDPLFGKLMGKVGAGFVEMPVPAVSSRLYWNRQPNLVGERARRFLGEIAVCAGGRSDRMAT